MPLEQQWCTHIGSCLMHREHFLEGGKGVEEMTSHQVGE